MSELMNLDGVVYISNCLNHFGRTHHIMLGEEYSLTDLQEVRANPEGNYEGRLHIMKNTTRLVEEIPGDELAKEDKYFSCPYFDTGTYVWGHRKEEQIDGKRQRIIVEINKSLYFTSFNEPLMTFVTAMDVRNEIKQTWGWRNTYPDYQIGTLLADAESGEVSGSNNAEQTLEVSRRGTWKLKNGSQVQAHLAYNVAMTIGSTFSVTKMGSSGTYQVMDQVIIDSGSIPANDIDGIELGNSFYAWNSGRITANWLNRSLTMDIQLGCN